MQLSKYWPSGLMRISCARVHLRERQPWTGARFPTYQWYRFHAARVFYMHFLCGFLCNKRGYVPSPNSAFYSSTSGVKTYHGLLVQEYSSWFKPPRDMQTHLVVCCNINCSLDQELWFDLKVTSLVLLKKTTAFFQFFSCFFARTLHVFASSGITSIDCQCPEIKTKCVDTKVI